MGWNLYIILFIHHFVRNYALIWRESIFDEPLLLAKWGAFIGSGGSSIWILGGHEHPTEMIEFNTEDSSFTEHSNSFSFGYQQGQSSTQNGDLLYMLASGKSNIYVFNLTSGERMTSLTIWGAGHLNEIDQTSFTCLAYYKQHLMILGGKPSYNNNYGRKFIIYDIENEVWSTGTTLPIGTGRASCNVVNDILYLIGGGIMDSGTHGFSTSDVRTINVSQVPNVNEPWNLMEANLTQSRERHRSVTLPDSNLIYVVGGENSDTMKIGETALSSVDIIDTISQTIYFDSNLVRAQRDIALIYSNHNQIWYSFGGYPTSTGGVTNDYYQHTVNVVLTTAPSVSPGTSLTGSSSPIYQYANNFMLFIVFGFKLINV